MYESFNFLIILIIVSSKSIFILMNILNLKTMNKSIWNALPCSFSLDVYVVWGVYEWLVFCQKYFLALWFPGEVVLILLLCLDLRTRSHILNFAVPNFNKLFWARVAHMGILKEWTWMQILAMNYRCWKRLKLSIQIRWKFSEQVTCNDAVLVITVSIFPRMVPFALLKYFGCRFWALNLGCGFKEKDYFFKQSYFLISNFLTYSDEHL